MFSLLHKSMYLSLIYNKKHTNNYLNFDIVSDTIQAVDYKRHLNRGVQSELSELGSGKRTAQAQKKKNINLYQNLRTQVKHRWTQNPRSQCTKQWTSTKLDITHLWFASVSLTHTFSTETFFKQQNKHHRTEQRTLRHFVMNMKIRILYHMMQFITTITSPLL